VTEAERAELMALATDFPRLWRDPRTQMKEKKRMLRLLIEDVTLTKGDALHVDIRFVGDATRSLDLPLPKSCMELRTTDAEVVKEIDQLIDTYTDREIADVLNERGVRTVVTTPWTAARIGRLRTIYGLTRPAYAPARRGTSGPARCGCPLRRRALDRTPLAPPRSASGTSH